MNVMDFVRLYFIWRKEPESLRPLNLYPVWEAEPDFFRSAQPGETDLPWLLRELDLRSVLILRGNVESWEGDLLAQAGVALHHVPMTATRAPTDDEVAQLLTVARTAEKPILSHCQAGADRTGVWSFLVRYELLRLDKSISLRALAARYFHLPEVNADTRVLRAWAERYERSPD